MSLSKQSILLEKVKKVLSISNKNILDSLKECCDLLRESFYFANFKAKTLHLKAFSGIPTKHTSIRFGKGICGQVAVSNQNFMVPDIRYQDNYIACSVDVKSELVVPLFFEEKNIGQIDIDSDKINPFSIEDELLLEACCGLISKTYGSSLLSL